MSGTLDHKFAKHADYFIVTVKGAKAARRLKAPLNRFDRYSPPLFPGFAVRWLGAGSARDRVPERRPTAGQGFAAVGGVSCSSTARKVVRPSALLKKKR